ncbi:hypothetical protein Tco_0794050 [Tanacetum coccineum]
MALDYQNPFYLKQAQQKQHSLYNGKVLLVKHDPPAVYDSEETLQLAQETDESLAKHKALEYEIERLLRAVVSQDIMLIMQNHSVVDTSNLRTELNPYKDMQQKIERLQAQLGDLKGKSKDTLYVSDTLDRLSQKLEDDNVSSKGNSIKLAIRNENFEVVCATCKQCLITANHDECVLKYVNGMNSSKKNQSANVSKSANQKKHNPNVKKSKKLVRDKKYAELTKQEKRQDDCDVQELNIVLQGTEFSYQEREYKLYNVFDKFTSIKGESLHEYYLRCAQPINDIHTIGMTMQQVQVNTKFLNALQPEWSKFVTDVKLAKNMYNINFDQLYAYLIQHEGHTNEA